jgi:hypothetical protein
MTFVVRTQWSRITPGARHSQQSDPPRSVNHTRFHTVLGPVRLRTQNLQRSGLLPVHQEEDVKRFGDRSALETPRAGTISMQ